jgi:dihydropyrimidinase
MYTQMVTKRGYTLNHFVDMVSVNAAKIMGLYPRKGALAVGSDADIVVFDPGAERVPSAADLHSAAGYSLYEGERLVGWPERVFVRGHLVYDRGEFPDEPIGRHVPVSP